MVQVASDAAGVCAAAAEMATMAPVATASPLAAVVVHGVPSARRPTYRSVRLPGWRRRWSPAGARRDAPRTARGAFRDGAGRRRVARALTQRERARLRAAAARRVNVEAARHRYHRDGPRRRTVVVAFGSRRRG